MRIKAVKGKIRKCFYVAQQDSFAMPTVSSKLAVLRNALADDRLLAYVHKIDKVLFVHGGLGLERRLMLPQHSDRQADRHRQINKLTNRRINEL